MHKSDSDSAPWYRQFWLWFIIAIPLTSITYTLSAVYLFSQNSVDLVAEDYYKKGKAINLDLSKLKYADKLKLAANLSFQDSEGTLIFDKGTLSAYPPLSIIFTHRTLANKDFQQMITPDHKGVYRFKTLNAITGPWFIKLSTFENTWVLQSAINLPTNHATSLQGHRL